MRAKHPASSVPSSRFERLAHLGGLAGRVAGGMLAEGMRQVARGNLRLRMPGVSARSFQNCVARP
jgi:hypothetical protein